MSSIYLKISSLLIRTLSKPIANRIKDQARQHEGFRKICVSFAQSVHRLDMRLRLGLLQDQAAIDRQIAREAAERKAKADIPTVKTEAQTKADEAVKGKDGTDSHDKERERKRTRIRPLTEAKAIDSGANFISEGFLFSVGLGLILFETWRSRRKESNRRLDVEGRFTVQEGRIAALENANRTQAEQLSDLQSQGTASSLWQKWHGSNQSAAGQSSKAKAIPSAAVPEAVHQEREEKPEKGNKDKASES